MTSKSKKNDAKEEDDSFDEKPIAEDKDVEIDIIKQQRADLNHFNKHGIKKEL